MPFQKRSFWQNFLLVVSILLVGAIGGAATNSIFFAYLRSDITQQQPVMEIEKQLTYIEESSVIEAISESMPIIVTVTDNRNLSSLKSEPVSKYDSGTGWIYTADGLIVTANHVVADSGASFSVILNNDNIYPAQILARDPLFDLAILKITTTSGENLDNLPVATFANVSNLQLGQKAIITKNKKVSVGYITALNQTLSTSRGILSHLIQTDAFTRAGFSGAPITNLNGQIIGMVLARENESGHGMILPINLIEPLLDSYLENGKISRPYLGAKTVFVSPSQASEMNIVSGALITGNSAQGQFAIAPDSPAQKAGLLKNDIILTFDHEEISAQKPFDYLLAQKEIGAEIPIKIWRKGEELILQVKLGQK